MPETIPYKMPAWWTPDKLAYLQSLGWTIAEVEEFAKNHPFGFDPMPGGEQQPPLPHDPRDWTNPYTGENEPWGRPPVPTTPTTPTWTGPDFEDPTKYFDSAFIQNLYNIASGNLSRTAASGVAGAQRSAGAQAGARGLLNPMQAILGAGSQVRGQYAPVFGGLEQGRAGALSENQRLLWQAFMQKQGAEEAAREFHVTAGMTQQQIDTAKQDMLNRYSTALKTLEFERAKLTPNALDYGNLAVNAAAALAMVLKYCWIAEELYGKDDMRTVYARYAVNLIWPRTKVGRFFKRLYGNYGIKTATVINKYPVLRYVFLPIFEMIWRQGFKEARNDYSTVA